MTPPWLLDYLEDHSWTLPENSWWSRLFDWERWEAERTKLEDKGPRPVPSEPSPVPSETAAERELRILIEQTEAELALGPDIEAFHAYVLSSQGPPHDREANQRMYEDWVNAREELLENLRLAKENPGAYASLGLAHWKEALWEVNDLGHILSHNVGVIYGEKITDLRRELGQEASRLRDLKARLETIRDRLRVLDGMETAAAVLEKALLVIETYEALKDGEPKLAELVVVAAKAEGLKELIHTVADHARTQVIQMEGYATLDDLLRDVEAQVDRVDNKARQLAEAERVLNHAEEIHKQPYRGQARP
jgi:hypothetical protein